MKLTVLATCMVAVVTAPSWAQGAPTDQLAAGRAHVAARRLDSAAAVFRRVAETTATPQADRVQAWVMLGVVDFYRYGDSAAADAFRRALELDPELEVEDLREFDPAIADILAAQRRAPAADTGAPASPAAPMYDCLTKCPAGVVPPRFLFLPRMEIANASVGIYDRRSRTFLQFDAVISPAGSIEPETMKVSGGTARGTEGELRRALLQARFAPGRAADGPVRARVLLRFDFEAEGTNWVKYSYRVMAR